MWLKSEQSFVVSPYQSMILSVDVLQLIHSQTMAYDNKYKSQGMRWMTRRTGLDWQSDLKEGK